MVRSKHRGRQIDVEPAVVHIEAGLAAQDARDPEVDGDAVPQVSLDLGKLDRADNRDLDGERRVDGKREEVDVAAELKRRVCVERACR